MSGEQPPPPPDQPPAWPGAVPPPQPPPGQPPYGQQPYPQQPYGQQPYQQPYGQQPYPQQPYGYAQPGAQRPPWAPPVGPPKHPSAVTAMVLGIIGLAGVFLCGLGTVVAPFAWWLGQKTVSEIDADPTAMSGRSEAHAGKVMGIIGTILLVLVIAYFVFVFGVMLVYPSA